MDSAIVEATWRGALLSAVSNILGQAIGCWKAGIPISLDISNLFYFTLFAALSQPPNFSWQIWLEKKFPSRTRARGSSSGEKSAVATEPQSNWRNLAIKWLLDQTIGAAVNTVLYLGGMPLLRGESVEQARKTCREDFWPLIYDGWKLWPIFSFVNFYFTPAEYRTLAGSVAGMFWNIFLTLQSGKTKVATE